MSRKENTNVAAALAATGLCPSCSQPINNSNDARSIDTETTSPKRASKRRLTRSSTSSSIGPKRKWKEGLPVYVRTDDGHGEERWEEGIVSKVIDLNIVGGVYEINVLVPDSTGEMVVPRTIHSHNFDAIRNKVPSDPNYRLDKYIRERHECLEGLSGLERQYMRCVLSHDDGANKANAGDTELDVLGEALLRDDRESSTSLRNVVRAMMVDKKVKEVVAAATNESECSPQQALAYLVGQFCGIELSESVSRDVDPRQLLDWLDGDIHLQIDCPISRIFLISAMTSRTLKQKKMHPSTSLFDSKARDVLSDPVKLRERMSRLDTALAAIHASQTERPPVTGAAFALLRHGIRMMIDMRGTSDPLLNRLAEEGVCRPAGVLRKWIQLLADAIDPLDTRSPAPSGRSHVLVWTADNADYHLFHRVVSCVPVGSILLGVESESDTSHFNLHYMRGLGRLADLKAEDLAAIDEEDQIAQDVIVCQNILAIIIAAADADWISDRPAANSSGSTNQSAIADNTMVWFTYRSAERMGTFKAYNDNSSATVEFWDGGILVSKDIPLCDIATKEREDGAPAQEQSGQGEQPPVPRAQANAQPPDPDMFNGERHRFDPSTTNIASILTGLSSKNSQTAREVIQEVIRIHGEDKFHEPTIIAQFFAGLNRRDELPIIPCLAIGHALKGLEVSMMSFYQCFFDPILATLGVKEGSPEYNKYYKGTVIRNTSSLVMDFTEMLAVAAARQYLTEVGRNSRVKLADGSVTSPKAIIDQYFISSNSPSDCVKTVIDSNMRPLTITVTDPMKRVANDLQEWARGKWSSDKRPDVGPSGFKRASPDAIAQVLDPEQAELSRRIEENAAYEAYKTKGYWDNGDELGLLTLCTNAKLLGKSSPKDTETLAKKLFLHEVKGDSEMALKFGPARTVPKGTNSTGLAIYDLIFGPERLATVMGHLLTRVRPRDPKRNQQYPREWLVFFKALTVSTFMRWQPHYQRLSLAFLIQLNLILKHKDRRCIDLALKRIRWTFCLSEKGDSHKCCPVDLFQEHAMVEQVKKVGRRDTSAIHNLESRIKLHSYVRMRRVEARAQQYNFESILPVRGSIVQEEQRRADCVLGFWVDVLEDLDNFDPLTSNCEQILGLGDGDDKIQILFADRSRAYWRVIDATDHILQSASAFIKGFILGCEVVIPPRSITILRQLHRIRAKKKSNLQSKLKAFAEQSKMDAAQRLEDDGHVIVPSSKSLLDGIEKAGEGKAAAVPAVLSLVSKNKPCSLEGSRFGGHPSKPVVLTRSKYEADRHVFKRSEQPNGHAPIAVIVDFAKDLRAFFPRREGGKGNSVIELARDMICQAVKKYVGIGVEVLCLTMDVAECMTSLRVIPHAKRGKMDGIKTPHGSLAKVKKGSDDLTPHGARSDLLVCGDAHFTKLLFDTVANEIKAIATGTWSPPLKGRNFVLALIGGSRQACVAVGIGTDRVRLNSKSIAVSCQEFENKMERSQIVRQEEGEVMIFGALAAMLQMGFTHERSDEGIDIIAVLHSDDSDAFAGMSMQAMFYLESTCILRNKTFTGAVYLHGSSKSAAQVSNLGEIFQTNIEIDKELCPTGRGFEFLADLVAIYKTLEQDNSLPKLPRGHRAMAVASVSYTLTNHDYLKTAPFSGLTCSKLIATMKSPQYKAEVRQYRVEEISPIHIPPRAVFHDQKPSIDTGYNLPGILVLLQHAFMNRSATNKVLKLTKKELNSALGYDVVRACAVLAGELHPVPDPIATLAHISCANFHFQRWTCKPYAASRCVDKDLSATCYTEGVVKGRSVMSVEYDLCRIADANKRGAWKDETLLRELRNTCYGILFSDAQLKTNVVLPFDPIGEVKEALKYRGHYPSKKISKELLPEMPRPSTASSTTDGDDEELAVELSNIREEALHDLEVDSAEEEGDSDGERSVAGSMSGDESDSDDEVEDERGHSDS